MASANCVSQVDSTKGSWLLESVAAVTCWPQPVSVDHGELSILRDPRRQGSRRIG